MDDRLRREIAQHRLAMCCEDCAFFVEETGACALLYPNAVHRLAALEAARDGDPIWFCKMFEPADAPPQG